MATKEAQLPVLSYAVAADARAPLVHVSLERLIASRLLIQANSGGGKSRAIRQLLEETHGQVQHLVIDPEGEFATLRERFPYVLAGKEADVLVSPKTARLLCRRLMELGASAILDLYDLPMQERRETVRLLLSELMSLPRTLWRPLLVIIDEAHVFCPERGSGESQSTEAVITLCTQGRKRGFAAVLATQRVSKLHKDAAAELLNKLVGRTGLDVDVKRAGDDLGFDKEQRQALKSLAPGEFFVYGPATSTTVVKVRTGDVRTVHPEAGRLMAAPSPAPAAIQSVLAQLGDLPRQAEAEAKSLQELEQQVRMLKGELTRAQRTSSVASPEELAMARAQGHGEGVTVTMNTMRSTLASVVTSIESANRAIVDALYHGKLVAPPGGNPGAPLAPLAPVASPRAAAEAPSARPAPTVTKAATDAGVSGPEGRVLNALAQLERLGIAPAERLQVALFAGYTENGHFNNLLGRLSSSGRLCYPTPGHVELTDDGRALIGEVSGFETLEALHGFWLQKLSGPESRVLQVLVAQYPSAMPRADLASAAGYTENGHFNNILGRLNSLGVAHYPTRGYVAAAAVLFPDALMAGRS